MAKVNLKDLANREKNMKTGGDGSKRWLKQKDLTEETLVRFLPCSPHLNGIPYLEVVRIWVKITDKWQSFLSFQTFYNLTGETDKICPALNEIQLAKSSKDRKVSMLANDEERLKIDYPVWMSLLQLKEADEAGEFLVVDDCAKMLEITSKAFLKKIIGKDVMTNRMMAAIKAEDGMMDRVDGYNTVLSREKTGSRPQDVRYSASIAEQWEASEKYYVNLLDPYETAKGMLKGGKYIKAFIRQYLYGEEIPAAVQAAEDKRVKERKEEMEKKEKAANAKAEAAATKKPTSTKAGSAKKSTATKEVEDIEFEEDEDDSKTKTTKPSTKNDGKRRTAVDTLLGDDDEDEDQDDEDQDNDTDSSDLEDDDTDDLPFD